jgi:aminoglycoside 6'-N-acetyltransferase
LFVTKTAEPSIQYYFLTENLPKGVKDYNNPLFNHYEPNKIVGIDCFIATAEHRGKSLGHEMITHFITEFLLNFKAVIVDPNKTNKSAIRCYEKAGFKASTCSAKIFSQYFLMANQTQTISGKLQ